MSDRAEKMKQNMTRLKDKNVEKFNPYVEQLRESLLKDPKVLSQQRHSPWFTPQTQPYVKLATSFSYLEYQRKQKLQLQWE